MPPFGAPFAFLRAETTDDGSIILASPRSMRTILVTSALVAFALAPRVADAAPILGMIDTFQSGTTEGWFAGGGPFGAAPPVPPAVVASGGPTGINDAFLQITAIGQDGPGSRLVAMNALQWTGDFAGLTTIEMDVINLGGTDLTLRLLFENPIAGPPTDVAITSGVALPSASGWTHVAFAIDNASLAALVGSVDALMANVTLLRLIHNAGADLNADPIAAVLGVDNISAGPVSRPGPFDPGLPVPEPAAMTLVAMGIAALGHRRRRCN